MSYYTDKYGGAWQFPPEPATDEPDAYADGADAYLAGRSFTDNPNDANLESVRHMSWNDGWNHASEDASVR